MSDSGEARAKRRWGRGILPLTCLALALLAFAFSGKLAAGNVGADVTFKSVAACAAALLFHWTMRRIYGASASAPWDARLMPRLFDLFVALVIGFLWGAYAIWVKKTGG
jgi:lipopolysaccharide export LptBFGC system permease protein LptF